MFNCKYCQGDEVCINADCPNCGAKMDGGVDDEVD